MDYVSIKPSRIKGAGLGIFSKKFIPKGMYLGEYIGRPLTEDRFYLLFKKGKVDQNYAFDVNSGRQHFILDATNLKDSNWTRFINCSRNDQEENVIYKDENGKIKFYARFDIYPNEELLFYYSDSYARKLGIEYNSICY